MMDQVENVTAVAPIDASAATTTVLARNFILQAVLVAGAIVAALGLPETSWLARAVHFLKQDEVKPLIGLVASLIASGWILLRAWKKDHALKVASLLLPEQVIKSPAQPSASVVAAAQAATVAIDQPGGAAPADIDAPRDPRRGIY